MKKIFEKMKEESGQALVIVALGLVALLGITAFSVDLGMAYNAKAELQAAADSAALAGAQDLPNKTLAKGSAENYAGFNEVGVDDVSVTFSTELNPKRIEVTCSKSFEYLFAKVLGFDSKIIVARAVAEKQLIWGGETLPFLNIDDPVSAAGDKIVLWEKTGTPTTGDFELLLDNNRHSEYEFTYDGDSKKDAINCMLDGLGDSSIDIKNGINASLDPEIAYLCDLWSPNEFIYVLSLANVPTTPEDQMNYINSRAIKENGKVTSASISLDDIVLLKCRIVSYNLGSTVDRGIVLEYSGTSINLGAAIRDKTYIPGFANSDFRIKLVE